MAAMRFNAIFALAMSASSVFALTGVARAEETWIEVRSPHFRVLTDGTAGDARKVAYEFEQIRHVFVLRFNNEDVGSGAPLTIVAARNGGTVSQIAPLLWKARGDTVAGFFERRWEEQFALVRLDTWGDNNQAVAYHEYTHSVMHANAHWLPVWLDEGMAEFYAYSQFEHDRTLIGSPTRRYRALKNNTLLPVSTMLELNQRSPYYHDEFKMQLFYAEAWAMVHYMTFGEGMENGAKLNAFFKGLQDGTPQQKAFESAFGDVHAFDNKFSQYVLQNAFKVGVLPADPALNPKNFTDRRLTPAEADYEIGQFQIGMHDGKDGLASLEKALAADPKLAGAHEELGFYDFDHGRDEDAKKEWQMAVSLDPNQARSAFALTMSGKPIASQSLGELQATQLALRHVAELAPKFAPVFVELAMVEVRQGTTQQAYKDARQAEALEPWRAGYHLLTGRILLLGNQPKVAANYSRFVAARWYGSDRSEAVDLWQAVPPDQRGEGQPLSMDLAAGIATARGTLVDVSCATEPGSKFSVTFQPDSPAGAKPLVFAVDSYVNVGFSDTFWYGEDHFNRCFRLTGHPGVILYKPQGTDAGQLLEIEVRDDLPTLREAKTSEREQAVSLHPAP